MQTMQSKDSNNKKKNTFILQLYTEQHSYHEEDGYNF